jgi:hypothetical protein
MGKSFDAKGSQEVEIWSEVMKRVPSDGKIEILTLNDF